ncbi:hypothetical protein ATANTOWER_000580 [Ataeniobius toweri]|uniref:PEHE domain-containing protein n=1 Tax=Ataeniobius toweri TaxID=208326 RepID=A0ABU7ACL0_9TELE|nr:hypothetical protein [Ataeniobius toweri]
MLEENLGQFTLSRATQGFLRKHRRGRVYNINDIVIPVPLSKVEKPQYKDILTPSWRVIDVQGLTATKADEDQKMEDLSDEVFARRHLALEQKEKRRWSSWEKRMTSCRRPTRSGSRLSSSAGGMCTSGEEGSVEWNCPQLDSDEQPWSEEQMICATPQLCDPPKQTATFTEMMQATKNELSDGTGPNKAFSRFILQLKEFHMLFIFHCI